MTQWVKIVYDHRSNFMILKFEDKEKEEEHIRENTML